MTLARLTRDRDAPDAREARLPDFGGELLRPGDPGFDTAAALWNGTIDATPGLIARCATAADVSAAVRFAAGNGILLSVRGGGHNVAGTASCKGGLMIDLSPMNGVHVDADARVAQAGGGTTWGDVDGATQEHHLAAPGGLVSKTGVGGLTLGGGYGWLRRKHGLSSDALVSAQIVTADGEIREASPTENADLFWAIRGGGGNFGVVTRFDFRLYPVGPEVMFGFVLYPLEEGRTVLRGWRDFCADAPDEITALALCGTVPAEAPFPAEAHGRDFVALATMHAGPAADGTEALRPLGELGTPLADFSGPAPYTEVQQHFDEDYPDGMRYYWKSLYMERCDDGAIDALLDLARERPSPLTTVEIWQLGGAMSRIDADASAFGSRAAPWMLAVESNWQDPAADKLNRDWTRAACSRMERFSTGRSYLNFEPDTTRGAEDASPRMRKLRQVKRHRDPENLFRMNHNIAPAGT